MRLLRLTTNNKIEYNEPIFMIDNESQQDTEAVLIDTSESSPQYQPRGELMVTSDENDDIVMGMGIAEDEIDDGLVPMLMAGHAHTTVVAGESGKKKKSKIGGFILSLLTWLVFIAAFVLMVFAVAVKISGNSTGFFGLGFFSVRSDSMNPQIKKGDLVIARKIDDISALKVDVDNILFNYTVDGAKIVIVHRLIEIDTDTVTTHGIAAAEGENEIVPHSDIIGKSVLVIGGLGSVIDFLNTTTGFFVFVFTPIALIIIYEIFNIIRIVRHKKRD